LAERTVLTVELGLQTIHDKTAFIINRGHTFDDFVEGYDKLRRANPRINICVHFIFGLPEENEEMMLQSVRKVSELRPDQVKFHLLHVLRGTKLGEMYLEGKYAPMSQEEYVDVVAKALCMLPPETVVGRITGDGIQSELLSPEWSRRKTAVINDIDKKMYSEGLWQGKLYAL
jgi:radical SAM protein (TIGR01212 family)